MADWHQVARASEIPAGSSKEVEWQGRLVALFNVEGRIYAIDGVCPHQGGPLAEGTLEGCVVACPWHGWRFDVTTGRNISNSAQKQQDYKVQVEGGVVSLCWP